MNPNIPTLVARVTELDERRAAIDAELRRQVGHAPRHEYVEALLRGIRARQERFQQMKGRGASPAAGEVLQRLHSGRPLQIEQAETAFDLLCWLFADEIAALAADAVARLDYREGPSREERAARRAELSAERAALLEERERLVEQVNNEGGGMVHLDHHTEAAQRRQREEAERRQREAQEAVQQEVARLVEERRRQPRASRSSYIESRGQTW